MNCASFSELNLYYSKIREIGHHTRDCDGKKFIIINQTHWYDADKWTDETAAENYKKLVSENAPKTNAEFIFSDNN